jgi:hypothetical protein
MPMRDDWVSDPQSASSPAIARWLGPLLVRRPLLDGLSWRLIGLTTLVALPFPLANWISMEDPLDWGRTLYYTLGFVLEGYCVLLTGIVLTNARGGALPRPLALALAVLLGSVLAGALIELSFVLGYPTKGRPDTGSILGNVFWLARKTALTWGFLVAAWYFMQRAAERGAALREAELARHQLEARIVEARLQVMQAQTEPHFLFNTLSHVKRLYRTDPALGRRMLDRFCDYLRATLPQMRGEGATLGREIDLARAYLDVQKIRMGQRLAVAIDVAPDLRDRAFPSMMLLTLVENAVKHGLSPLPDGGAITISAHTRDGALEVAVADSGAGFSTTKGTGVGLSNIRARLQSLYGSSARLTLAPGSPRGIVAAVAIPL